MFKRTLTHLFTQTIIVHYKCELCSNVIRFSWHGIKCCSAANFTQRRDVCGDNRTAASHCLNRGKTEAFVKRRKDEAGRRTIKRLKLTVTDTTDIGRRAWQSSFVAKDSVVQPASDDQSHASHGKHLRRSTQRTKIFVRRQITDCQDETPWN